MIVLILLAYVMIALMTIFQYKEQTKEYNARRFERKEDAARLDIRYELNETDFAITSGNLLKIFKNSMFEIASVHKMHIKMYDLEGELLVSSENEVSNEKNISEKYLDQLESKKAYRLIQADNDEESSLQASYTYIYNNVEEAIGILKLYYLQDNSSQDRDLREFLSRLGLLYILMFFVAIALAYFLSSYITKSINTVIAKMSKTGLNRKNEKIYLTGASIEIQKLVYAFNDMIDELEESAVKLAQSEREQAWREMAKQVAHEIKNPLTPMRLTVQSFERRFDPKDPEIKEKVKEYSETIIQQIDVMSSIASAFSDFAQMPTKRKEDVEVVGVIKMALDIFDKDFITFQTIEETIDAVLDKSQLVRIVTNLIQNAIHATKEKENPLINLNLIDNVKTIKIEVKDNGKGIGDDLKELVFEPRFTTKSSGMGLGLPMIRKIIEGYGGSISFDSIVNVGTVFTIVLPKE
jgi:nitrogen fixation/metabolism regulation signal transduction histidine kinase